MITVYASDFACFFFKFLDIPGRKVELTNEMNFISESSNKRVPCYRILNEVGCQISTDGFNEVIYVLINI